MTNATRKWITELTLTPTELTRFWARVDKSDECWTWLGKPNGSGYGTYAFRGTSTSAHRASYMLTGATIPPGMVLDHLCRNRTCVNPAHLEPVTPKTNSRRSPLVYKDACTKGHKYTPENTRTYSDGPTAGQRRYCLICMRDRSRKNMARYRAERRPYAVGGG